MMKEYSAKFEWWVVYKNSKEEKAIILFEILI